MTLLLTSQLQATVKQRRCITVSQIAVHILTIDEQPPRTS